MSTDIKKIVYDVGSDSSVALKVGKKLMVLAEELHLIEYVTRDDYVKRARPVVPNNATAEATRKHELEMAEFKQEVDSIKKLREAAEGHLSTAAYEQLCVRLGRSTSDCLSPKELIDGIKTHYARLTTAKAEDVLNAMQTPWQEGTSLSAHIIRQATMFADLKAGDRAIPEREGKATLWRSLTALKKNPVYATLTAMMRVPLEEESVPMAQYVATFLAELQEMQYADLNSDTAASAAAEVALAVKDKETREQKLKDKMRANKAKYATHPLDEQCPVHPGNEHTWGSCSHYTGKRFFATKKK